MMEDVGMQDVHFNEVSAPAHVVFNDSALWFTLSVRGTKALLSVAAVDTSV